MILCINIWEETNFFLTFHSLSKVLTRTLSLLFLYHADMPVVLLSSAPQEKTKLSSVYSITASLKVKVMPSWQLLTSPRQVSVRKREETFLLNM